MFNRQPQKIYKVPKRQHKKVRGDGMQLRWKCFYCIADFRNKIDAKRHMISCEQRDKLLRTHQLYQQQSISIQGDQNQLFKLQIDQLKSKMQFFENIIPMATQISEVDKIETIVNKILDQNTFISTLRTILFNQVNIIMERGYSVKDIILKSKEIILKNIMQIDIQKQFSGFQLNMEKIKDRLLNITEGYSKNHKSRILSGFQYLRNCGEKNLMHQSKTIDHLSTLTHYKRQVIMKTHLFLINNFQDQYPFKPFPRRLLLEEKGNKVKRKIVSPVQLFELIKTLLANGRYQLATDIWLNACLGFRSRQYMKIQLQNSAGQIAKLIKVYQYKNNFTATRFIPRSLANMVKKHSISMPITPERFKEARNYCLQKLGSFYGLRSFSITWVVSSVLSSSSQLFKYHWRNETTLNYYFDENTQKTLNKVFAIQGYDQDIQSNIMAHIGYSVVEFKIIEPNIQLQLNQNQQIILEQSIKDSIISGNVEENGLTHENTITSIELKNNIEVSSDGYDSIHELLQLDKDKNLLQTLQRFSQRENININILQIDSEIQNIKPLKKIGENFIQQVQIIKQVRGNSQIVKLDQSKISRRQIIEKIKNLQANHWPLLRSYLNCKNCRKRLTINKCHQHYKVICHHCDYDDHNCENKPQQIITCKQIICNFSKQKSIHRLKLIQFKKTKNNIQSVIKSSGRSYIKKTLFEKDLHPFNINLPQYDDQMARYIELVQNNEFYLPIYLKMTKIGWGVFAKDKIPRNTIICTYAGVLMECQSANNKDDSIVDVGMFYLDNKPKYVMLTCHTHCNVGRYLNSATSPKSKSLNVNISRGMHGNKFVLILYSTKDIQIDQQLKWYYGHQYFDDCGFVASSDNQMDIEQMEIHDEQCQNLSNEHIYQQDEQEQLFDDRQIQQFQQKEIIPVKKMDQKRLKIIQRSVKKDNQFAAYGCYNSTNFIAYNPQVRHQIASIVKVIVAKVCLRMIYSKTIQFQSKLTMPDFFSQVKCTSAYLKVGREYRIKDLLDAILVCSGCDAAFCIAYNVGKILNPIQPIKRFVQQMNFQVASLGMDNTVIYSPTGLCQSYSTVSDLVKLVKWMMEQPYIEEVLKKNEIEIQRKLSNTNKCLRSRIYGKTGFGRKGHCFAGYNQDTRTIIITLGAVDPLFTYPKLQDLNREMKKTL